MEPFNNPVHLASVGMCASVRWQFSHCEGDVLRGGAAEFPAASCGVLENSARCAGGDCKAGRGQTGCKLVGGLQMPHGQETLESRSGRGEAPHPNTVGSVGTPSGLISGDEV